VTLILSPGCKFGDVVAASLINACCSSGVATPRLSTLAQLAKLAQPSNIAPTGFMIFAHTSQPPGKKEPFGSSPK